MVLCLGACPQFTSSAIAKEGSAEAAAKETEPQEAAAKEASSPESTVATDKEDQGEAPKKAKGKKPAVEDSAEAAPDKKADEQKHAEGDSEEAASDADEEADVEVEVVDESVEEEPEAPEPAEPKPPVTEEPTVEEPKVTKRIIGATATIMEKKSEILFRARIDTGAKTCSLHVEDMKIENESEVMAENIGKVVRFHIRNGHKDSDWLEAKIASYVIVKTSNDGGERKRRYKVPLTFRWKDVEKTVLVTLNDREHMDYPLLIGRNFLGGDFMVDVELDSDD